MKTRSIVKMGLVLLVAIIAMVSLHYGKFGHKNTEGRQKEYVYKVPAPIHVLSYNIEQSDEIIFLMKTSQKGAEYFDVNGKCYAVDTDGKEGAFEKNVECCLLINTRDLAKLEK